MVEGGGRCYLLRPRLEYLPKRDLGDANSPPAQVNGRQEAEPNGFIRSVPRNAQKRRSLSHGQRIWSGLPVERFVCTSHGVALPVQRRRGLHPQQKISPHYNAGLSYAQADASIVARIDVSVNRTESSGAMPRPEHERGGVIDPLKSIPAYDRGRAVLDGSSNSMSRRSACGSVWHPRSTATTSWSSRASQAGPAHST